jgi:hypothetical protein
VGVCAPNRRRGCRHDQWCGTLIIEAGKRNSAEKGASMIYKRTGHWHLDVTIHGVRHREALNTTDKRQAKELEKNRIAEIKQGKNASKTANLRASRFTKPQRSTSKNASRTFPNGPLPLVFQNCSKIPLSLVLLF